MQNSANGSIWEPLGAEGRLAGPFKNFEGISPWASSPSEHQRTESERVGLDISLAYVKVAALRDPEERVGQVKVREWRHSRMAYAETRDNGRLLIDD